MDLLKQFLVLRQQRNLYLDINPSQLNCPSQYLNQFLKPRHVLVIIYIRYVQISLVYMWQLPVLRDLAAIQLYIILR